MVDVALLAEVIWCTVLFSRRGLHRTLLYAGGVITAGYAASQLSGWISKTLVPPTSAAFRWVSSQVVTSTHGVSVLSAFIPPEAASVAGVSHVQWVAYHIVQTLIYVAITCAIFATFAVIALLRDALWDHVHVPNSTGESALAFLLAGGCGAYITILTAALFANLAWLRGFEVFATAADGSLLVHWIGGVVSRML